MLIFMTLSLLPNVTIAKTIKVAVIDTGFDFKATWQPNSDDLPRKPTLCRTGHTDFTGTGINDSHGHGTHIAGLIGKYAGYADYCLVILKYYKPDTDITNLANSILAINLAIDQKVDVINYSGGGLLKSELECAAIVQALDKGIKVVAAAGNERLDLDKFNYYPALCDPRVIVVEGLDSFGNRVPSSNYSTHKITTVKELGNHVLSTLPNGQYGYMTGTSQATAIVSGKTVKKLYDLQKLDNLYIPKLLRSQRRMLASDMQCK